MEIKRIQVYGLENSVRVSKFPMSIDPDKNTEKILDITNTLATSKKGEGHDNFLQGIIVQFDMTATNKFWIEYMRYHFSDIVSSTSTIHKIVEFDLDKSYCKYVDKRIIDIIKEKVNEYNNLADKNSEKAKELYLEILYSNPSGFETTSGITTNYRQLKTMYSQRKAHTLPEWKYFCDMLETLPHSEWITGKKKNQ